MYLGRVVGCVWATVKHPDMQGLSMLIVQPVTPDMRPSGRRLVCTDAMGAGAGDLVYWVRGREAALPFAPAAPPVDTTVVGIVDSLHLAPPVQAPAQAAPTRRKRARKE